MAVCLKDLQGSLLQRFFVWKLSAAKL